MSNCKYETSNGRCGLKGSYAYRHKCYTEDMCRCHEPKTNADHIRSMADEELAERNVQDYLEYTVDCDWDENPIGEYTPFFKTSDGAIFWYYEDAVEYELHWLKQPYKEDT